MTKFFLSLIFVLSTIVVATDTNPFANITWTKNNVPKGCFPDKKNRIVCEEYQDANNRNIKIIDTSKNMMYIYIKIDGTASTFNASHCNDLMAVPSNTNDELVKSLLKGDIDKYTKLLTESMHNGEWGWNCNGSRTIRNVICMLNGKKSHYAKISKYDDMGFLDSEKETIVNSIIGDYCRDIFDGI